MAAAPLRARAGRARGAGRWLQRVRAAQRRGRQPRGRRLRALRRLPRRRPVRAAAPLRAPRRLPRRADRHAAADAAQHEGAERRQPAGQRRRRALRLLLPAPPAVPAARPLPLAAPPRAPAPAHATLASQRRRCSFQTVLQKVKKVIRGAPPCPTLVNSSVHGVSSRPTSLQQTDTLVYTIIKTSAQSIYYSVMVK